jgi:uncharacterized protein YegJ (DUF2314 family)
MNNVRFVDYDRFTIDKIILNHMVKITLIDDTREESFWVWTESIDYTNNSLTGIISNNLLTYKLEIGQVITFDCINIKDVSERLYTKEETDKSIMIAKVNNNPITKYFQSLNIRFI